MNSPRSKHGTRQSRGGALRWWEPVHGPGASRRAAGVALCTAAAALRLTGRYWLGDFQVGTLLQIGVAGMVLGCLCLLAGAHGAVQGAALIAPARAVSGAA
jgi:hypothetical protein